MPAHKCPTAHATFAFQLHLAQCKRPFAGREDEAIVICRHDRARLGRDVGNYCTQEDLQLSAAGHKPHRYVRQIEQEPSNHHSLDQRLLREARQNQRGPAGEEQSGQ